MIIIKNIISLEERKKKHRNRVCYTVLQYTEKY